ncbi:unnamed protein product [Adineta ricciae]|uniref:TIR domain-containing protein n=1 Tax=Adineta ricciae TaxID=249248 RepID=A0A814EIQ0_ADIRI|nr:unnamed protein product [Adineta ricciae]CAF1436595.1 unnamed protein product [Adineta ricciae]
MDESRPTRQRTIQVVSLLDKIHLKKEPDLPTLLSNLRESLLKKSEDDDQIDSNIIQLTESIKVKLEGLEKFYQKKEIFDILQTTLERFINDIISITKLPNILSNERFLDIIHIIILSAETLELRSIIENDPPYARTICFRFFNLLASPVITDFLNEKISLVLFELIAYVLRTITSYITITIEVIVFKKNELQNQVPILRSLLKYIDCHKANSDFTEKRTAVDSLFTFIWSLANDTILVPTLIEAECPKYVLQWIANEDIPSGMQQPCIHIIHNIARHEKGVKVLNDANGITILKDFKRRVLDPNKNNQDELYTELRLVYCMAVSLLTEPKENHEDLDNLRKILDQLMQLAVDAGQSVQNKYRGFHVSEPIVVLTKLCIHDEILNYVLNESNVQRMEAPTKIQFFCHLLVKFRAAVATDDDLDQLTLIALFNIIWSISFHDKYLSELKKNFQFLLTIKTLAVDNTAGSVDQYVPNHMSSIPKAAQGILWNLDEDNPGRLVRNTTAESTATTLAEPVTDETNKTRVMVSYCHTDQEFCRQLVDALKKDNRLHIWVDFAYCHTEDFWEEIGEAIEKANVVLFLMSKEYQDSKSCRQEVMYAKDSLKKRFIPIYVKKDFQASGWLGVRIVGPQYIRFEKRPFADTMKELLKLIFEDKTTTVSAPKEEIKPLPPPPVTETKPTESTVKPSEPIPTLTDFKPLKKPVEQWTSKEISQWFSDNQIHRELVDIYDFKHGTDLLLYSQCLRPDWQIEYNDMKERYQQKYHTPLYRDQFVRFVGAMNRLKPSQSKSKTCVIS